MRTHVFALAALVAILGAHLAAATGTSVLHDALQTKVTAAKAAVSAKISAKQEKSMMMVSKMEVPQEEAPGAAPVVPDGCLSAYALVSDNDNYSLLKAAIDAAGLQSVLDNPSLVATIFAPDNEAVVATLEEPGITAEELLSDTDNLAAILSYHVVPGVSLASEELKDSQDYETLYCIKVQNLLKKTTEDECDVLVYEKDKIIDLKTKQVTSPAILVTSSGQEVVISVPDIQKDCPTSVHGISEVLISALQQPEFVELVVVPEEEVNDNEDDE